MMKRGLWSSAMLMLLAASLIAGCGQKSSEQAQTTSSDSLLAATPSEPAPGSLTPEQQYQAGREQTEAPAPAPPPTRRSSTRPAAPRPRPAATSPGVTMPAGTGVKLTLDAAMTSETAQEGDAWSGTVKDPVVVGTAAPIPAGSKVAGVVAAVQPAGGKSTRAYLVLRVTSVEVDGKSHGVSATSDTLFASSATGRNVGAIAGGTAAGALLGRVIGGSSKGAVIGGVVGGAAATAGVLKSKGYQSVVKAGQEIEVHTTGTVVMK